ncbi:hypothetical protein GC170_19395 [bacterium]|nr:hypothetical protein [bacterium]
MSRTESHLVLAVAPARPLREVACVAILCIALAIVLHAPSLFRPGDYVMSPADLLLRQPELGGSAEFVPLNRLLIDPVLQFEPWEAWIGQELAGGRFAWWNPYSGTGAPLAANGQSRLFDPLAWAFRALPGGRNVAAESAMRTVLCGLGIYALTLAMGGNAWVRCWAALAIPMTAWFTLWRLYPLASAATVLPWLWLACLRLRESRSFRSFAWASLAVGWTVVAGNVQVAAVGFCGAAVLLIVTLEPHKIIDLRTWLRIATPQATALACGLALSAPAWAGLLDYLDRSPVWADRLAEHMGKGRGAHARLADLPCLVFPFIYGSERRGDANVAKAIGATNVNEAASGHVGLIAAVALIPLAFSALGRSSDRIFRWSVILFICGIWIGYRLPPVNLLWHRLPLFQGIDPRRFVVLATFGGTLLAAIGLQILATGPAGSRFERLAPRIWIMMAIGCILISIFPLTVHGRLEAQARRHYEASIPPGLDHARIVEARVADQLNGLTRSWPAYLAGRSIWLLALAGIWRRFSDQPRRRALAVGLLALAELTAFGWSYNPQIRAGELAKSLDLRVIAALKELDSKARSKGHEARFLAVGECFPPNQLMRFGLKDLRNYDSIELLATLEGLEQLFETEDGNRDRSSRRPIEWAGVRRSAEVLRDRGVIGVVGHTKPETDIFDMVLEPIPGVFVGVWASRPKIEGPAELVEEAGGSLRIRLERPTGELPRPVRLRIRESFDSGWRISGDAEAAAILRPEPSTGMMLCEIGPRYGGSELLLTYRPLWFDRSIVPAALAAGACALGLVAPRGQFRKWSESYFSG